MRIGVVSSTVFPCPPAGYAGLEMIAYHCAKGLAERGHHVTVFCPEGSYVPGCHVFAFGPPQQVDEKTAYSRYWQHLLEQDAVIDHSWQKWSYALKREGRLTAPVLAVMHAPVNTMLQSPPPVEKPCVVCISEDQAAHYQALFNQPARVCYNGIDLDYYKPLAVPRTDRFLFLARFSAIKGALLAIEACHAAGVGLDLIGDTSITNEPDYLKQCQDAADGVRIKIHGGCSRGETVWWYSRAHAMIHPVRDFREPFGLAPVEAQACGCPVIAWDNGAMRETIVNGQTGQLVASETELRRAVEHYARLGVPPATRAACREHASKFSVFNMAARYEALCREAIERGW